MWGPIVEKVFAKMKGAYLNADGGRQQNSLRYLTNAPVISYWSDDIKEDQSFLNDWWKIWKEAYDNKYILNIGTRVGSDKDMNECGVSFGHAYAVLALFDLTDDSGVEHNMFLIRNPWGEATYTDLWNAKDARWNDELVK